MTFKKIVTKGVGKILRFFTNPVKLIWCFLSTSNLELDNLVIVTGADSSHYKSLCQFLTSLSTYEPDLTVVAYDLGFNKEERLDLIRAYPNIDLRRFDYSKYPDYFNIRIVYTVRFGRRLGHLLYVYALYIFMSK